MAKKKDYRWAGKRMDKFYPPNPWWEGVVLVAIGIVSLAVWIFAIYGAYEFSKFF